MYRFLATLAVGVVLSLPLAAGASTTLPDIQSAFEPAYHLSLRTTTSARGVVDGVALNLSFSPPALAAGTASLPSAFDASLGREDGRSHPRRAPRRAPSPAPRYHGGAWVPIALVLALVIVITCPTFVVLYY